MSTARAQNKTVTPSGKPAATAAAKHTNDKAATGQAKKLTAKESAARTALVLKELEAQVAAYAAENAALKAERAKAVQNVNQAVQDELDNDRVRIDRPKGTAGDGFSLQEEMCLADNVKLYRRCQRTVRRCVDKAGLDERLGFRNQDTEKLVKVYKAAKEFQPYLKRFVNDWATAEFVKMLLRNRRALSTRREREEEERQHDDIDPMDLEELNNF